MPVMLLCEAIAVGVKERSREINLSGTTICSGSSLGGAGVETKEHRLSNNWWITSYHRSPSTA